MAIIAAIGARKFIDWKTLRGYQSSLIAANKSYLERITAAPGRLSSVSLKEFVAAEIGSGSIIYFEPYEEIHRRNLGLLQA
jgi:cyclase